MSDRLWPWSLFAAMIAAAGLPIYIHAPKLYVDDYGVSLAALGVVLAALRLFDVVQDPILGWLVDAQKKHRGKWVGGAVFLLGLAMLGLFAVTPPVAPLLWFAITMTVMFSAFSFLTIAFYAQGVEKAGDLGDEGHLRLAGWRESGGLIGVSLAAVLPVFLGFWLAAPYVGFAVGFAVLAVFAAIAMRPEWSVVALPGMATAPSLRAIMASLRPALADTVARRLLLLGLVNAAPVAVTSTLFLFFVESKLALPTWAGGFLLLFFLSAAASASAWSALGRRFGEKPVLLAGMGLAIAAFLWALALQSGQGAAFALICVASGAALGADMVLLPAIFARRLSQIGGEGVGFGLWAFVSKLALALAALTLLPALQWVGFQSGTDNPPLALQTLSLLYAALPCVLKAISALLLALTPLEME